MQPLKVINHKKMAYTRLTAAEAAAMINDQDNIGLSGFTPNGVPKATFRELSKRAVAEHEAGRPFQVGASAFLLQPLQPFFLASPVTTVAL